MPRHVFVTGGTGYIGRALLDALVTRGSRLPRARDGRRPPRACPAASAPYSAVRSTPTPIADEVPPADTFVQLVGTAASGAAQGRRVRARRPPSGLAAVNASVQASVRHLVYVSVAHPAPVMQAYDRRRARGGERIAKRLRDVVARRDDLRPVVRARSGTPLAVSALRPLYALGRALPSTRAGAHTARVSSRTRKWSRARRAVENPPDNSSSERECGGAAHRPGATRRWNGCADAAAGTGRTIADVAPRGHIIGVRSRSPTALHARLRHSSAFLLAVACHGASRPAMNRRA
jgi:hypothetical protein